MTYSSRLILATGLLLGSGFVTKPVQLIAQDSSVEKLCEQVLRAETRTKRGEAYQALFEHVGQKGLSDLTKSTDTGIALQASWELHKKLIKRAKHIPGRTDDIYDPDQIAKFLVVLKDRTKAPVPEWWSTTLQDVGVFTGEHHAFWGDLDPQLQRTRKGGPYHPKGVKLTENGDQLKYAASGRAISVNKSAFKVQLADYYPGYVDEKAAYLAPCWLQCAVPFQVAALEGKGGKPAWVADVWAANGGGGGSGPPHHRVEVVATDKAVYVFGSEAHGMYVEAFDAATGMNLFRFCTCYWDRFSERWNIK
ncbi:Uncharacterized protein OS=Planctomyces limnophilus (strain ATCC 43296 / DSM 3776 / IFAM 1008 / 290) GN=Plim_1006 PE=4 SV=1 [Gemmataceae bacterium]|nr:Uncharacterized protein OS=Planctomyces limnophilus (strain ATCC 43296 / DSM 3776 / IFAM 1008 / 290) GN=Plim_1006 PE=4 SV=1 [Gemmataceae bacterium]VTU02329.1 Uncharacterized protein OS=Planctomyces limnophilus (strain ATCC 43296 / DSM 3776 / IFAM 1008 / 290) GN=Plim_1006 PE=4 SV=1 [Gemmataceae bacterium]